MTETQTGTHLQIPLDPNMLWAGLGVVVFFYIIITVILVYHWIEYGYKPGKISVMTMIYFIGSIILLATGAFSIISYTVTL